MGVLDGDPNLLFDRIRTLAVDSIGGFWVSDSHESIRHYGPEGEYLGHVGGEVQEGACINISGPCRTLTSFAALRVPAFGRSGGK